MLMSEYGWTIEYVAGLTVHQMEGCIDAIRARYQAQKDAIEDANA